MLVVQSVTEQVRDHLSRAIIEGTFPPNAVLSDRQLAEQLGASRTPIREAFHQLEAIGLVKRRSRVGWVVADLQPRDVEELIELRTVLEVTGVRRVVAWPDERRHAIAAMFDGFRAPMDPEARDAFLRQDRIFHGELVDATNNSRIVELYRIVEWQIDRIRHLVSYGIRNRVDISLGEHREICAAIAAHDAEAAIAALGNHLGNIGKQYLELMDASAVPRTG